MAGHRVDVEGVGQRFQKVEALADVSFSIGSGEFVAVLGPSGCGKSTLLRIVAGLLRPTSGVVRLNGTVVESPQVDLGIVFQTPILMEWRRSLENVLLQAELRGLDPRPLVERANQLLAMTGLADFRHALPRELSGGMRQRVAICRALLLDPPLLLMDEPFGALDALTREQMRLDLEEIWMETQKTVLFITHSIDEAVLLADRVIVMSPRPGRIDRVLSIDLSRPRGLECKHDPQFAQYVNEIHSLFLERGILRRSSKTSLKGVPAPPFVVEQK